MPDEPATNALLIDLDGVIYQSDEIIKGAVDALAWLMEEHIPYLFVTNTTSRSRRALLEKLRAMGIYVEQDEIVTPIVAARHWLKAQGFNKAALFVTPGAQEDFLGIESVPLSSVSSVDAVVIGDLGEAWDYKMLNSAFRFLMQEPRPELIALGMTRYWRGKNGLQLDVAPFIRALEYASACEARVFGKPAAAFFESVLALLNCRADQALMIGDDIVGDTDAAQRYGIRGLQVKTGKFRDTDLGGTIKPFAVLDSIAALPDWWSTTIRSL